VLSFSGSGVAYGPAVARSFISAGVVIAVIATAGRNAAGSRGGNSTGNPTAGINKAPKEDRITATVNRHCVIVSKSA
jgi:predicted histidine transporter YuiF (NhaC family)